MTPSKIRDLLLRKGFFPEVLPPCFDSSSLSRSFSGLVKTINDIRYNQRVSDFIRYNGTKHDYNRRYYGTVNPIPYFSVCNFIGKNWSVFEKKFGESHFGISNLHFGDEKSDRAIIVPSLSEISPEFMRKLSYSPFMVKTDIAQFFPSIYTHSLPWVAHGKLTSKSDTNRKSDLVYFNSLDWFIQQCQNGQTRGVLVGPDGFRIVAEYLATEIDLELKNKSSEFIVGCIRHVDDFYIGIRNEIEYSIVLSSLREILQSFELQINDSKTKLLNGLQPIDDVWAQELRRIYVSEFSDDNVDDFIFLIDKAFEISQNIGSQSPIKLILRRFDRLKIYQNDIWIDLEPKLQRVLYHFPHCIDYVCLLLAKRFAIEKSIDSSGWIFSIEILINKSINSNHHHELVWLLWVSIVCKFQINSKIISRASQVPNGYVKSILISAFQLGVLSEAPEIKLGGSLSTTDENWLHNLIGKSTGFSNAKFSGSFSFEFEKLVTNGIKLIDFKRHMKNISQLEKEAISSTKYGYDSIEEDDGDDEVRLFDTSEYWDDDLPW
ncbi:hypothetical protein GCM10009119_19410 [Algoriphagus jejuensis]|uniref:Reverse transcriptase (RNA-dependent DNA polymerase) n=1 Tax=Algoriphagus jejuensis TaxID=419934 RepID=A0ABP3YDC8_9BACT